jgi:putative tricarboxylic transport membrane protein
VETLGNLRDGLYAVMTLQTLFLIFVGLVSGLLVGALPGLTATMAVAVLVPVTFGLTAVPALSMLLAIYVGAISGGAVSAILANTPGTPASVATTFDGYPMARLGRAGRALGLSLMVSIVGSLIGIAALVALSPVISRAALRFSAPEYFALAFFGLTMVIGISGRDLLKGIVSALLGLYIGFVGLDPMLGVQRFTMGNMNLLGGFSFVPVLIGLFAIAEVLVQVTRVREEQPRFAAVQNVLPSLRELFSHRWLLLKSGLIGTFIGALPGAGADIASLVSYNEAKRSSKHPERFGRGSEEGLMASETANNAVIGAAMIPLLTLAIPGDAVTAVLLGAMRMHDLRPGPLLFQHNSDEVFAMYIALVVAVVMLRVVGLFMVRVFSRVMNLPKRYLLSGILLFSFVGAYALGNSIFDLGTALAFGVIGYVMLRFGYPVAPLVLALILGPLAEDRLRQALVMSRGDWSILFTRPISATILVAALLFLVFALRQQRLISRMREDIEDEVAPT